MKREKENRLFLLIKYILNPNDCQQFLQDLSSLIVGLLILQFMLNILYGIVERGKLIKIKQRRLKVMFKQNNYYLDSNLVRTPLSFISIKWK